jgi:hypothetical protein
VPIKDLQLRFAQVGVIRLGEQRINPKTNKPYPAKLETFRFTSASRPLIEAVAAEYGGEVKPWQHPSGPQFEVITGVAEVAVFIPRQNIDPNYELWGNKYRARLCDGETERIRPTGCLCIVGPNGHVHDFDRGACACGAKRACKPTTRLSLLLANREGRPMSVGSWKVEAHGWNAASELPLFAKAIAVAVDPIPGRLELQSRDGNILVVKNGEEKIEPRKYGVPVLHVDMATAQRAFSGELGGPHRAALGGGGQRQALAAVPAEQATTVEQFKTLANLATDPQTIRDLWERAKAGGVLDEDLRAYFSARAEKLGAAAKTAPANGSTTPPATPPPVGDVVIAETEPDGKQVFDEILALCAERGWNMPTLAEKFEARMGFDYRDDKATGWKLAEFRDALKAGEIQ